MKMLNIKCSWIGFLFLASLLFAACEDKWDGHYDAGEKETAAYATVLDYLNSDPELSHFLELLEQAGYDTLLSASQSYTVWAPLNSALSGLQLESATDVLNFVENHITRGSVPHSVLSAQRLVPLMNGKRIFLYSDGEEVLYNDVSFDTTNIRTGNGLVHRLDGFVPYTDNIWEYLTTGSGIDSLKDYLNSLTQMVFVPEESAQIGFNEDGNVVYDSTFRAYNEFLRTKGSLNVEDSIYSVLLLSDQAWNEGYDLIRPRYRFPTARGGVSRSEIASREAIVNHLVLRTDGREVASLDSVVSTARGVFYNPHYLFAGAEEVDMSNGKGFRVDHYPFVDTLTWFKTIELEAELSAGRSAANFFYSVRSGRGLQEKVSGSFLVLEPSLAADAPKASVTFTVPDVLAGRYRLYVEFLPTTIDNPDNQRSSKATFMITHLNTNAGGSARVRVTTPQETNPASKTKMFVAELNLPFANKVTEDHRDPALTLQITNEVTQAEENAGQYTRSMRIDRILLEPVVEL